MLSLVLGGAVPLAEVFVDRSRARVGALRLPGVGVNASLSGMGLPPAAVLADGQQDHECGNGEAENESCGRHVMPFNPKTTSLLLSTFYRFASLFMNNTLVPRECFWGVSCSNSVACDERVVGLVNILPDSETIRDLRTRYAS